MLKGIIFDKDGTLFDFQRTWGAWGESALLKLSKGDEELCERLADAVGFDRSLGRFQPESPAIAGTNAEISLILQANMPERSQADILFELNALSREVELSEAVPLIPFLSALAGYGLRLGVATNDAEDSARAHLGMAGAADHFHHIFGYDSGFGAKPGPGMLLAFCDFEGLDPAEVAMVGDSTHDLQAGRDAGMITIGVLTGMAKAADLSALADEIVPDIGHLPASKYFAGLRAEAAEV